MGQQALIAEILGTIFHETNSAATMSRRKMAIQQLSDSNYLELVETLGEKLKLVPTTEFDWKRLENWLPSLYSRANFGELSPAETAESNIQTQDSVRSDTAAGRLLAAIRTIYLAAPANTNLRNLCLAWIARLGNPAALEVWAQLLVDSPPEFRLGIHLAFAPLVSRRPVPDTVFNQLLQGGLAHPQIAGPALDLMNYQTREQILTTHPASGRAAELSRLLGWLVDRLEQIEEGLASPEQDLLKIQQSIADSVAMITSLCDALALMGYQAAEGKLLRATELRHRRVQTEAAAALARLGFDSGKDKLIALAGEPTARLRVLAYADELNFLRDIPETHQSEIALAESKLANWLAEPLQMGLAPSSLSLIDCREMYWPGFEHPVQCYLFRFQYGSSPGGYTNIGIVGPLVHCFESDIGWMSLDDIYAAFAGWHAVHDDIYEISLDECEQRHPGWISRITDRLQDQSYIDLQPEFVGVFMESRFLVAAAQQHETDGFVIAAENITNWFANSEHSSQVNAEWAYMVYRGRLILKTFNSFEPGPYDGPDAME